MRTIRRRSAARLARAGARLAAGVLLLACVQAPVPEVTVIGSPYEAAITIGAVGRPVNRLVLGSNVQWVDGGDALLKRNSTEFDDRRLAMVASLRPTLLRYPGGSQGDTYRWRAGVGPAAERGENELFFQRGKRQRVMFGTAEFLELCRRVGAEPLITVNATTGTAEEAAEWVRLTNRTGLTAPDGTRLGPVRYWEIDNEPYLRNDARPEFHISAAEYAARAERFIRAMRAVDPSIVVGVPLRSDTVGVLMLEQQTPGFARTVLSEVDAPFEWVALHNAYFPFLWNPRETVTDTQLFRATMAAARVVERDFDQTRALLRRHRPGQRVQIGVTEYNALFSFGGQRDGYIATLGGALYVADLLRLFATTDDLLLANHWSLSDNWYFGSVTQQLPLSFSPEPRPAYHVLRAYDAVLRGRLVAVDVRAPTFDGPALGLLPAVAGVPLVGAVATRESGPNGEVLRMLVLNRDPTRPAALTVRGPGGALRGVVQRELADSLLYDVRGARKAITWRDRPSPGSAFPLQLRLPPHSLTWLEVTLPRGTS